MEQIGKILRRRELISEDQLCHVINLQKRSHIRLGDILIAEGILTYLELYNAIAEHYGFEFVNLFERPPTEKLLSIYDIEDYIYFRAIPWRKDGNKTIIATAEYSEATKQWIKDNFGDDTEIVITSPLDIRKTIERIFGSFLEEESKLRLWKKTLKNQPVHQIIIF